MRDLFYEAVRTAVLPRLDAQGLSASDAWRRREGSAATTSPGA